MCLNEIYIKAHISKRLSDSFPIQNGLKQGDTLSPPLFNYALEQAWATFPSLGAKLSFCLRVKGRTKLLVIIIKLYIIS
jgi:hypothetical protein